MTISGLMQLSLRPALAALCIGSASWAQALSLVVENGEITGVVGIEIQGTLYDVTFSNGTFNALYPNGLNGYGQLAEGAAGALRAASESGLIHSDSNLEQGLRPRGCGARTTCTMLIPDHSDGAAPSALTTYARELIYSDEQFRSGNSTLWPFDASTDTTYAPDMSYVILAPAN